MNGLTIIYSKRRNTEIEAGQRVEGIREGKYLGDDAAAMVAVDSPKTARQCVNAVLRWHACGSG